MAILVKIRKTLSQNFILFIFCGITGWYLGGLLDDRQNYLELTEKYEQVGPMTYKERMPTILRPGSAEANAQREKDKKFMGDLDLLAKSLGPQLNGDVPPGSQLSFDQEPSHANSNEDDYDSNSKESVDSNHPQSISD